MKRVSRNALSILVSDVGRRLVGFFSVTYLTRTISVNDFGAMNIGLTLLSYGLMISSGGLSTFGTREVAVRDDAGVVNRIVGTRVLNAFLVYAIILIAASVVMTDQLTFRFTFLFCLSLFTNAFFLDWYFQGKEAMGAIGVSRLGAAFVYLGMILFFVHGASDVLWVAAAALGSDLVVTLWLLDRYRRGGGRRVTPSFEGWRSMMRQAFPLGAGSIFAHLSINLPPLVIGVVCSNVEVGLYSASVKLVFVLLMLDRVVGTILLPASARFYAESTESLSRTLTIALQWILVAALPVAVGGSFLGGSLVPAIFGAQYAPASAAFRVLVWYFFFTLLHTVYANGLVAARREKAFSVLMAVSAALYFLCVVSGTLIAGNTGAAAGVVAAEAVTVALMYWQCRRVIPVRFPAKSLRILGSGVILAATLWFLPDEQLVYAVLAGAVVYGASVLLSGAVTKTDIDALRARL